MSIEEMFAHYIECENQNALNNYLQSGVDNKKTPFSYPFAQK